VVKTTTTTAKTPVEVVELDADKKLQQPEYQPPQPEPEPEPKPDTDLQDLEDNKRPDLKSIDEHEATVVQEVDNNLSHQHQAAETRVEGNGSSMVSSAVTTLLISAAFALRMAA